MPGRQAQVSMEADAKDTNIHRKAGGHVEKANEQSNSQTGDIMIMEMAEQKRKEVGTTKIELKSSEVDTAEM